MFEHRSEALLPRHLFRRRVVRYATYAGALLVGSLTMGTVGFAYFADEKPIDALLNAAMLLGGMGPVGQFDSTAGKLFATFFALYAGLAFLGIATILFAPIFHRLIHGFHVEEQRRKEISGGTKKPSSRGTQESP